MTAPERHRLLVRRDLQEIMRAMVWIEELSEQYGAPMKVMSVLQMVIEEALSNVILHALPEDHPLDIELVWEWHPEEAGVTLILADSGDAFNPLAQSNVDVTLDVDSRDIGGLGIHLVRTYMDRCEYERIDHRNILKLTKGFA